MYAEIFNQLIKLVRPFMKAQGFISRGNNFYKRHPQGNIGIINKQKNREGFPRFTINVGIYSVVLAKYFLAEFNQKVVKEYPSLGDYHWESRIGSLVPIQNPARQRDEDWRKFGDKWWWYDDTSNVEKLFNEIKSLILDYGISEIDQHITDQQLQTAWLAEAGTGGPNRLKYLCVLLEHSGDKEQRSTVLNEFGKFMQSHPELTGLKKHYDRFIKEADLNKEEKCSTPRNLNQTSAKRSVSEKKPSISENPSKKIKP